MDEYCKLLLDDGCEWPHDLKATFSGADVFIFATSTRNNICCRLHEYWPNTCICINVWEILSCLLFPHTFVFSYVFSQFTTVVKPQPGKVPTCFRLATWCWNSTHSKLNRGKLRKKPQGYNTTIMVYITLSSLTINSWARGSNHKSSNLCFSCVKSYRKLWLSNLLGN